MRSLKSLFGRSPAIIGMVHVGPMPGAPLVPDWLARRNAPTEVAADISTYTDLLIEHAVREADIYSKFGLDGIIIENMWDLPYVKNAGPHVVSFMTRVCTEVRRSCSLPAGVQIVAACNKEALAVAAATGLQFIRAEGYVFGHVADEGYIESCAGELLRYRRTLCADHISIMCDIKKKHSAHAITADVSLADTAKAADLFLADALIVTGLATGEATQPEDVSSAKSATTLPVYVGSGVCAQNLDKYSLADGWIVGSEFKRGGNWRNEVEEERVKRFMEACEWGDVFRQK